MQRFLSGSIATVSVLALALVLFLTRTTWQEWLGLAPTIEKEPDAHAAHGPVERVKLSPQAQLNLRLLVKPVQLDTFRRTLQVPGVVVERRGKGDLTFSAPITGVVKSVAAYPGDTVVPGQALVTLRINSEPFQMSQTELYKATQEVAITEDQKKRLEEIKDAIPAQRLVELKYQLDRLQTTRRAYRLDLALKGLLPADIDKVEKGDFVREMIVRVALVSEKSLDAPAGVTTSRAKEDGPLLEVEQLKVQPGEQVQAGQVLGHLSNHLNLYIEGRGFREDTPLLEKAATSDWPLEIRFLEETSPRGEAEEDKKMAWPELDAPLKILYLANSLDPVSQTFPFFVPLLNQYREYKQKGETYRIWRFRPGQRIQLGVPVQEFKEVFVLPVEAVVREGAEAYVFRRNGDVFERKTVHVAHEDSVHALIANDGSIFPGNHIALSGADAINRALKAQMEKAEGGSGHHGHSH